MLPSSNTVTVKGPLIRPQQGDSNGFELYANALLSLGYVPLPIAPWSKRPGIYAGRVTEITEFVESYFGHYDVAVGTAFGRGIEGWQAYTVGRYNDDQDLGYAFAEYCRMPELGLGVLCGNGLVALDIDSDDPVLLESVRLSIAEAEGTFVAKRGKRGHTIFFRGNVPSCKIKIAGRDDAIDILSDGRQSVLPPTMHPGACRPYEWLSNSALWDVLTDDLPLITPELLLDIRAGLVRDGFELDVVHERSVEARRHASDSVYTRLNSRALANLGAWVDDLCLYEGKWIGARYAAVATWRPSGTGKALSERKRNLSISRKGIRDFGGEGYSPIGLVATALGLDWRAAASWLSKRVGVEPMPELAGWWHQQPEDRRDGENGYDSQAQQDSSEAPRTDTLADVERELVRFAREYVEEVIPARRRAEDRLQALVGDDGAIMGAARKHAMLHSLYLEHRAELERAEIDLAQQERELLAMEDEADLKGFPLSPIYVRQMEVGTAKDRAWRRAVQLACEHGPGLMTVVTEREALIAEAVELSSTYELLLMTPPPGSGKTRVNIDEVLSKLDIHVAMMSPTNSLGWDLQARSPAKAWAGLGGNGPDGEPLCLRRDEGRQIEAAGGSWRKLCDGCPHFTTCAGRAMIDAWYDAPHVAGTHNHLTLPRPDEMTRDVDAVVIDESPVSILRPGHVRLELADLSACLPLQNLVRASEQGGLRQSDLSRLDRQALKDVRKVLYRQVAERYDLTIEELRMAEPVAKLRLLIKLIEAVLFCDCAGEKRGDIVKVESGIMFAAHGELDRWAQGKPVLLATATPEPDEILQTTLSYTRFVPAPKIDGDNILVTFRPVRCGPTILRMAKFDIPAGKNVTVRRYANLKMDASGLGLGKAGTDCRTAADLEAIAVEEQWPGSTLRHRRAELERRLGLMEFLKRETANSRRVVVVATKRIRDWLESESAAVDLLPWGMAIGSNRYEDHDALVVLGSKIEPNFVRHLRASDFAGEWLVEPGDDTVSDHKRQSELWQAVERLRTRRDKAKPVTVHIFDDTPLPISADEVDGRPMLNSLCLEAELAQPVTRLGPIDNSYGTSLVTSDGPAFAITRRGLMEFHKMSERAAGKKAKEPIPAGYVVLEVTLRAPDGSRSTASWSRFAVAHGIDPKVAIESLTGRRVERVR